MKLLKITLLAILVISTTGVSAFVGKKFTFQKKRLLVFSPTLLNPDAYSIEFGFVTNKKIKKLDYHYNAFAKAFVGGEAHFEQKDQRSGALGAKAGVFLPTQKWYPVFLEFAFGYAKTALHKDPWFGDKDDAVSRKDMFLLEGGLVLLHRKKVLYRLTYQLNNVDYFEREIFLSVGGNY